MQNLQKGNRMRRNVFIAALLLPLPFAALPVVGVLVGGAGSNEIVIDASMTQQAPAWDLPESIQSSMAYGVADTSHRNCENASVPLIEG